jgi:hypothetical protein
VVCVVAAPPGNDHGADVTWLGFAANVRLSAGVAHKHEIAGLEVVRQECVLILALELVNGSEAGLEDVVVDGGEIAFM